MLLTCLAIWSVFEFELRNHARVQQGLHCAERLSYLPLISMFDSLIKVENMISSSLLFCRDAKYGM